MTIAYYTSDVTGAGVIANVTSGNGLYVASDAVLGSTDNFAVTATGDDLSLEINGTVYGQLGGLSLSAASNVTLLVSEGASVGADLNSGNAITLDDFSGDILNQGNIRGEHAIEVKGLDNDAHVVNRGFMQAAEEVIHLDSASTGTFTLLNYGKLSSSLSSSSSSIYDSEGQTSDLVLNNGVINGQIELGAKSDVYFGGQSKPMNDGTIALLFSILGGVNKFASLVDAGGGNDQLFGGKFSDYFAGGLGKDSLTGGGGDDYLAGGVGADTLTGGGGADVFVYLFANESHGKNGSDLIEDFSQKQHDKLSVFGVGDFDFIGTKKFSGNDPQLRYEFHNGNTFVLGNLDNDKQAEFEIHLHGKINLHQNDFTDVGIL